MKGYVLGFMFSDDKKHVVLIRKNKPAWQAGLLNGVGGKIEENELPHDAMVREFYEETGATHDSWELFAEMTNSQFIVYCYKASASGLRVESKTDEVVMRIKVDDLLTNEYQTIGNLKWLVTMALDNGFHPVTIKYHEADQYIEDGNR